LCPNIPADREPKAPAFVAIERETANSRKRIARALNALLASPSGTVGRSEEPRPPPLPFTIKERSMLDIKEHMEIIGADGVHIGTVDKVEGARIKLTKEDSGEGSHKGHHHFVDRSLVADVEGNKVRLSAIGAVAVTMEQEK
jgi:hypothetical protein